MYIDHIDSFCFDGVISANVVIPPMTASLCESLRKYSEQGAWINHNTVLYTCTYIYTFLNYDIGSLRKYNDDYNYDNNHNNGNGNDSVGYHTGNDVHDDDNYDDNGDNDGDDDDDYDDECDDDDDDIDDDDDDNYENEDDNCAYSDMRVLCMEILTISFSHG